MMKITILLVFLGMISCSIHTKHFVNEDSKLEIIKIDSADIYYIFNINDENNSIIIGEREHLKQCFPFKKYIIKDSIKRSPSIMAGNRKIYIGTWGFEIDDTKVKNAGEPVKYIDNCESFSD